MALGIISRSFRHGLPNQATLIDGAHVVGSAGSHWYVDSSQPEDNGGGLSWQSAFKTITAAMVHVRSGDTIHLAPGAYDETVLMNLANVTVIGEGGRGAAFIEPSAVGAEGMLVTADDVTLINVGVAGEATADYAIRLADDVARFRAYQSKFEGPDGTVVSMIGVGDIILEDCEIAWGGIGILFAGGLESFPTQVSLRRCKFHNLTTAHISDGDGNVNNLEATDNVFDAAEDGTEPTDYLLVDGATSTGIFSGNRFAVATNSSAVLTIAAGIQWVANATEAGWSTARPA